MTDSTWASHDYDDLITTAERCAAQIEASFGMYLDTTLSEKTRDSVLDDIEVWASSLNAITAEIRRRHEGSSQ